MIFFSCSPSYISKKIFFFFASNKFDEQVGKYCVRLWKYFNLVSPIFMVDHFVQI